MNEKMSRQTAAEFLDTLSDHSVLINISNTFPFVVTNVIMPLVKNDTEPFDIRKALEDAGVEVEG